jgi:hypothetical protein
MIRVALLVALCASCVRSGEVPCGDGRICAPGYYCDETNHRCLSDDQVAACAGKPEGADCSFGGAPGACRMGACEPLVCGDDVRTLGEACDGGDLGGADCTTAGFYEPAGLACTSFCTFDVSGCSGFCGDDITNGDELCDGTPPQGACFELGFDAGALACADSCGFSFESCGRFGWVAEAIGVASVNAFSGSSATDLWVVGEDVSGVGSIAHHDGVAWTRTSTASTDKLLAVWSISATDAWIASAAAGIGQPARPLHWNGTAWSTVAAAPLADYTDVWAASASAVFFTTNDTGVQWWNGTTWQALGALTGPLVAIRGASASDVWVAKGDGSLVHWTGSAWLPVAVDVTVRRIDVRSATSVWVVGPSTMSNAAAIAHWNGSTWTMYTDPAVATEAFSSLLAIEDNDVWVGGPLGQVRHFDGYAWTDSAARMTTEATAGFVGFRRLGELVIGVASNGFVHRYRGQMYGRLNTLDTTPVQSVWSAGPNATFVGDLRGAVNRYNGSTWTKHVIDATTVSFPALWGSGPSDVWASGASGRVWRWSGSGWSLETTLSSVASIWGTGASDVWFAGQTITHHDGMMFTPATVTGSGFTALGGSGPTDVWALSPQAGATTVVHRFDGATWSSTTEPHDMTAIVVLAPNDVFVTADDNHVLHFDGTTWTDTVVPVSTRLEYIAATAHDDVIAASTTEAVHFDGTRWTPLRLASESATSQVRDVFAAPGYIDFLVNASTAQVVRRLIRTQPWNCRAAETGCSDGVDDDCDGTADGLDADCP